MLVSCVVCFRSRPWFLQGGVPDHWSCHASWLITCLDCFIVSLIPAVRLRSRGTAHTLCLLLCANFLLYRFSPCWRKDIDCNLHLMHSWKFLFLFIHASTSMQMCRVAFKASLHAPLELCVLAVWSSGRVIDCLACRLLVPSGPIDLPVWVNQWLNGSTRASSTAAARIDHLYPAFTHHHLSQFISLFSVLFL